MFIIVYHLFPPWNQPNDFGHGRVSAPWRQLVVSHTCHIMSYIVILLFFICWARTDESLPWRSSPSHEQFFFQIKWSWWASGNLGIPRNIFASIQCDMEFIFECWTLVQLKRHISRIPPKKEEHYTVCRPILLTFYQKSCCTVSPFRKTQQQTLGQCTPASETRRVASVSGNSASLNISIQTWLLWLFMSIYHQTTDLHQPT